MVNALSIFYQFGSVADILIQWEYMGFFDFVLPFLLIFAVVFGILTQMKVFGDSKGVHVIIAFILGMLSIRAEFFRAFLSEMAPRLGVGLTVLLATLILIGLFTPKGAHKTILWILFGVGAVILIIILNQLYGIFGFRGNFGTFAGGDAISWIVMGVIFIGVIVAIVVSKGTTSTKDKFAALFGD